VVHIIPVMIKIVIFEIIFRKVQVQNL